MFDPNDKLASALWWAEQGFPVFPLVPGSKNPLTEHGFKNATTDPEVIRAWWKHTWPDANIGTPTAGLIVLDPDIRSGKDGLPKIGLQELARLQHEHQPLPRTLTVKTATGGQHIYFLSPSEQFTAHTKVPAYKDIDVKKVGGYCVLPPSTIDGVAYEFVDGVPAALHEAILPIPEWLARLVEKKVVKRTGRKKIVNGVEAGYVKALLDQIDPTTCRDYEGTRESWIQVLMAVHSASGGEPWGKQLAIEWSLRDTAYVGEAEDEVTKRWDGFKVDGGVTVRLLEDLVRARGGTIPTTILKDPLEAFLHKLGLAPRWNVLRDVIEIKTKPFEERGFMHLPDIFNTPHLSVLESIVVDEFGKSTKTTIATAVEVLAQRNAYDPLQEFIDNLPTWDGVPRVRKFFSTYCKSTDNMYTEAVGEFLFVSAIGRALKPGVQVDAVVVLEGKQGKGKTALIRRLAGPFHDNLAGIDTEKDQLMRVNRAWIIELGELNVMKKDLQRLKCFITERVDRYRRPFAREVSETLRRCIFIGSTDQSDYLSDTAGNRRWLPVAVGEIDLEAVSRHRDQLFAEALHMYNTEYSGYSEIRLPRSVWGLARQEQEDREVEDPWVETVSNYLLGHQEVFSKQRIRTTVILKDGLKIEDANAHSGHSRRLSDVMKKLGYKQVRYREGGDNLRGWEKV